MSDEHVDPQVDPALQAAQQELLRVKHERDQLLGTHERFNQAVAIAAKQDGAFAARLQALWSTGELPPETKTVSYEDDAPDLTDPTQLQRFIREAIQSEVTPLVAPLQRSSLETKTTTEYMRLAAKVGQENLERAMPKIQGLITKNNLTLDSLPGGLEAIYKLATYDDVGPSAIQQFQAQEQARQQQAAQLQGLPASGPSGPLPDVQKQLESLSYGSDDFNDVLRSIGKQMGMKE